MAAIIDLTDGSHERLARSGANGLVRRTTRVELRETTGDPRIRQTSTVRATEGSTHMLEDLHAAAAAADDDHVRLARRRLMPSVAASI